MIRSQDCPKCGDLDKDQDPFSTTSYYSVLDSTEPQWYLACSYDGEVYEKWEETRQCKSCGSQYVATATT